MKSAYNVTVDCTAKYNPYTLYAFIVCGLYSFLFVRSTCQIAIAICIIRSKQSTNLPGMPNANTQAHPSYESPDWLPPAPF